MGRADNQLIAIRHSCEVKSCNTMAICETQPLLMITIQITYRQERGMRILMLLRMLILMVLRILMLLRMHAQEACARGMRILGIFCTAIPKIICIYSR